MTDTNVATTGAGVPAAYDYGDDAGAGFENATASDFKLSFLAVLDAKSKQVETVDGAKAGKIINTVTNALFDDTLFVPAYMEHLYVEWIPRKDGGGGGVGFVGVHKLGDAMVQEALRKTDKWARNADGKLVLPKSPEGNDLVETYYFRGVQLVEDTGVILPAVIAMASTNIPIAQAWLSMADNEKRATGAPLYAHVYRLGTQKKAKAGNSWYTFAVSFAKGSAKASALDPASDAFQAAKAVYKVSNTGEAKVDYAAGGAGGEAAGEKKPGVTDEIPF